MDRRDIILSELDLVRLKGIEIGALSKPLVKRSDGYVLYIDHADTQSLRSKYDGNPFYELDAFVDVDVVWNEGSLAALLPVEFKADYVVASHVIEHVPDFIRWLNQIAEILTPAGQIRLAIPDKRFIFDRFRQVTRLSDVLASWICQNKTPGPQAIIDYVINATTVDATEVWQGRASKSHVVTTATLQHGLDTAVSARDNNDYVDAHCWVFTPASFVELMRDLARLNLVHLACQGFVDTPDCNIEFYVNLTPMVDQAAVIESWERILPDLGHGPSFDPIGNSMTQSRLDWISYCYSELANLTRKMVDLTQRSEKSPVTLYNPHLSTAITPDLMTGSIWMYFTLGSTSPPALMQFLGNGMIGLYVHVNETRWMIEDETLSLFHADGRTSTVFDQSFQCDGKVVLRGRHRLDQSSDLVLVLEQCS